MVRTPFSPPYIRCSPKRDEAPNYTVHTLSKSTSQWRRRYRIFLPPFFYFVVVAGRQTQVNLSALRNHVSIFPGRKNLRLTRLFCFLFSFFPSSAAAWRGLKEEGKIRERRRRIRQRSKYVGGGGRKKGIVPANRLASCSLGRHRPRRGGVMHI